MLKDHYFEPTYDTNFDDDVVSNFYEVALSESKTYKRMAGFFRSSSLAVAARGISTFIENDGIMQVVACPFFSEDDIRMINAVEDPVESGEILIDILDRELTPEAIENDYVEAMGWMLAHDRLKIRIVLVKNADDNVISEDLFHNKVGIMSDGHNTVVFSGSINESSSGWESNIEEFDVFCDWIDPPQRIERKISNFEKYWELGESKRKITKELPEAVKEKWIKSVPSDKRLLKIFKNKEKTPTGKSGICLRNYQKTAIQNWFDNDCVGILNMATGTGKTVTAIHALKRLINELNEKFVLVVAVPMQHLVEDPWIKTLEKEITPEHKLSLVRAYDSSKIWLKEAKTVQSNYVFGVTDNVALITTYDTLSSDAFINFVRGLKGKKILIADEVHNSGSDKYRDGLLEDYTYRLGLSATPARYLDDDGTKVIQNYFEKEVYTFSIYRAITEINPDTGKTYLSPYKYYPIFVTMNDEEIYEYKQYNAKLAKYAGKDDLTPNDLKIIQAWMIKRSRIVKNASSKMAKLIELIPEYKKQGIMKKCLIYCSDGRDPEDDGLRSRERVVKELNRNDIYCRKFTSEEGMKERKEILAAFDSGETEVLVAIKCLDEGVDVPSTRNAIIMASTGNPREYIQRRGRVLRQSDGKEFANIFDFVVIPRRDTSEYEVEAQIFTSEYKRFKEFSDYSLNKDENESLIRNVVDFSKIDLGEFRDD